MKNFEMKIPFDEKKYFLHLCRREWFTHVQTLPAHHAHMPTFQEFAAWIQKNLKLPVLTEVPASTEININQNQVKPMPMPCPKQQLLYLRPQALLKLPKLKRCAASCQKPKGAPREGTKSTAVPLAVQGALLTPLHST